MRVSGGLLLLAVASGCSGELGPSPRVLEQTFGESLFTLLCQRVAYSSSVEARQRALAAGSTGDGLPTVDVSGERYRRACRLGAAYLPADAPRWDPKVAALVAQREVLVAALDRLIPQTELDGVQRYVEELLPLTDDDRLPELVRQLGATLQRLGEDERLTSGLARLDARVGYRPRPVSLGLSREILGYAGLQRLLTEVGSFVGQGGAGQPALAALLEALAFELRSVTEVDQPSDPNRTLRLALDLLLSESPQFSSEGSPLLLTRRDHRGLALVERDEATSRLPSPFIDEDQDGLADVDAYGGLESSGPGPVPAPFHQDPAALDPAAARDSDGRALDEKGRPLYRYLDLNRTLLHALARDAAELLSGGAESAFDLLVGVGGLLGERRPAVKRQGGLTLSFRGYDIEHAPLLDLIHGALQLLRAPAMVRVLEAARRILTERPSSVARLAKSLLDCGARGGRHKEAQLDPQANLYDDLIRVVQQMAATPGLVEDLIRALADPRVKALGPLIESYALYADVHVLDSAGKQVVSPGFRVPVDRQQSDTGQNRSILQRLLHAVHNANGAKICNKENACLGITISGVDLCAVRFKACDLFEIDNAALFYAQSIARQREANGALTGVPRAHLRLKTENMPGWLAAIVGQIGEDQLLRLVTGIEQMSAHPSPEAVNRLLFRPTLPAATALLMNLPVDIDGHLINSYHQGTLLSWEVPHPQLPCTAGQACRFYEAFQPIMQAFADHQAEQLFVDLIAVLHHYWATRASKTHQLTDPSLPDFSYGAGASTWEPLVGEVFGESGLVDGISGLADAVASLSLSDGPAAVAVAQAVRALVDPAMSPGLRYRDGRTYSMTTDGKTRVPGGVSPFYLIADALAVKRAALARLASGGDARLALAWQSATSRLIDVLFAVEGSGDACRFRGAWAAARWAALLDFVRQRLEAHQSDSWEWLGETLPRAMEEVLGSPLFARLVDFVDLVAQQPRVRDALGELFGHLLDEAKSPSTVRVTVTALADLLQLLLDEDDLVPLARGAGLALDPRQGLAPAALDLLPDLCGGQGCQILSRLLGRACQEQRPGASVLQVILDLVTEVHRQHPGSGAPLVGPDLRQALQQTADFLVAKQTGLHEMFGILKNRCGGPCAGARGSADP